MRVRTIVIATAAALLAPACGGSGGPSADESVPVRAVAVVEAAADRTIEATSARMSFSMAFSEGEVEGDVRADGVVDFGSGDSAMTMDMGPLPGGGELEFRIVDAVTYFRFPEVMMAALGAETSWVRLDPAELVDGATGPEDLGLDQPDPREALAYLRGVSDDVEELGRAELRGEDVTLYEVVLDLRALVEEGAGELSSEEEELVAQGMDELESLGLDTLTARVWIDDEGRMRKMAYDLDLPAHEGGGTASFEMELYDFGVEVVVEAPPDDEVVDFTEIFGDLFGGNAPVTVPS